MQISMYIYVHIQIYEYTLYIYTWVCICMLALKMTWHPNKFILAGHVGHQWPFHWIRQMIRVGMQVNSRKNARGYGALYGGSRPKITTRGRMKQVSKPLPWQHNKPNSVWKPWFLIRSTVFAWIHDVLISWLLGSSCWVIVLSDITSSFEFWILTLLYMDFVRFYMQFQRTIIRPDLDFHPNQLLRHNVLCTFPWKCKELTLQEYAAYARDNKVGGYD